MPFWAFATFTATAWALDPNKSVDQYQIDCWNTDHGLPQASVQALLQSRDGYLWLGTQEGLVRFDGVSFRAYNRHNTGAFENHLVRALLQDRNGTVWIGTDGGLVLMREDGTFEALTTRHGLVHDGVNVLFQRSTDDSIWVGTDLGVSCISSGGILNLGQADGLPHPMVRAFAEDPEGRLLVGTGGGVAVLEGASVTSTLTTADGLSDDEVLELRSDSAGNVWIGTRNGLCRWRDGRLKTYTTADGLAHDTVWRVLEDSSARLWVGTSGGLNRLEDGVFSVLTSTQGLSYDIVWSLLEDREGSLWVGTSSGGLNRLRDGKLVTYTEHDGLTASFIWTVLQDRRGALWFGTDGGGLDRLDDTGVTALTAADGLLDNEVLSLCESAAGGLWVGTRAGLNLVRNGRVVDYPSLDGPLLGDIRTLYEDPDGTLWVGTNVSGLKRYDGRSFTTYSVADGLPSNSVFCLTQTSRGDLWIGTGSGASRYRDGTFQHLGTEHGLPGGYVLAIHEDAAGALWFGTSRGLVRFDGHQATTFTMAHGLHDELIYEILEDDLGNLWMSCNTGVFRVAKQELEEVAAGSRARVSSVAYCTADGMASQECNGGSQPAGWRTTDGRLWFPTVEGVAVIDPAAIPVNDVPPPVTIERLLVDGEDVTPHQELPSCAPGSKRFEITYTALSFIASQRLRFQYRLEPFDDEWIETVGRRTAYYTGLPPGRYRFQVRAANSDGIWSREAAGLAFVVRPYFYQTAWFAALSSALVLCLGLTLYRARMRRVEERYQAVLNERQRMARELHDTLAQGLTAISLQLEGITETLGFDNAAARDHLQMARRIVRTSLSDARRTVWNLRSQVLDGLHLGEALAQVAEQLTAGTSITTTVDVSGSRRGLSREIEGQLLRIGQEAITNAVRHSRCRHIHVGLNFQSGWIRLRVRDDGTGFDPESRAGADHLGLRGIKERAAALGGRLEITSQPGSGTQVQVAVPSSSRPRPLVKRSTARSEAPS